MTPTYRIELYDPESGDFTRELAEEQLGTPCVGMSKGRLKEAMREAYGCGYDHVSMFIERDDEGYERELAEAFQRAN